MSSQIIHSSYGEDFYETVVRDNLIVKITKFCGSSQFPREIGWDDLREEVQLDIVAKLNQD